MSTRTRATRVPFILGLLALSLAVLVGCGGSEETEDPATEASASSAPSLPSGAPSVDEAQLQEVQACLDAAGVDVQLPSGMPSDLPSGMPSDLPSDLPSDFPTELGSAGPLADPEVQAALEACGIEAPTAPAQ